MVKKLRAIALRREKHVTLGNDVKPDGCLWLSRGMQWAKWRHHNLEPLRKKDKMYDVSINSRRLLHIDSVDRIRVFAGTYVDATGRVDWDGVIRDHPGLCGLYVPDPSSLLPRQDAGMPKYWWYTMLDVSTACVWDVRCIDRFSPR